MDAAGDKEWSKRYGWANCREPYKTELDTLGSHWIEGALSNEQLALEAVRLLSELEWVSQPDPSSRAVRLDDVILHVKILTEAMLSATLQPQITPEQRRQLLDSMREHFGKREDLGR